MANIEKLLLVNASMNAEESRSRKLAMYFVDRLKEREAVRGEIVTRDLAKNHPPLLGENTIEVIKQDCASNSNAEQYQGYSEEIINEFESADAIVIATPLHNLGAPTALNAYFDALIRAQKTFKFGEHGLEGLVADRPVVLIVTSGGFHSESGSDYLTPRLKQLLHNIGITSIFSVCAEGMDIPETSKAEERKAVRKLDELLDDYTQVKKPVILKNS